MGSAEGGVEIEQVAAERPDAIVTIHADPLLGLLDWQARAAGVRARASAPTSRTPSRSPRASSGRCSPTTPTSSRSTRSRSSARPAPTAPPTERLQCLDAKITLDDSALARHPELEALRDPDEEDPADREAREAGPRRSSSSTARSAAWSTAPAWR